MNGPVTVVDFSDLSDVALGRTEDVLRKHLDRAGRQLDEAQTQLVALLAVKAEREGSEP